jgi:hypothetical protein
MVPGKSLARRRRDGSAFRPGFPKASPTHTASGMRRYADADRRWLLALGHDENEEAASHDREEPGEGASKHPSERTGRPARTNQKRR